MDRQLALLLLALFVRCALGAARAKREFMFVTDANSTDADCLGDCNAKFVADFEYSFNTTMDDFYDFPFHPLLLEHSSFLLYCNLNEQKTKCYIEKCNDQVTKAWPSSRQLQSADAVFSPSNFICDFKRQLFVEVRPCLAEAEPITFLKCDQQCSELISKGNVAMSNNTIFKVDELKAYEEALDSLCSFQTCYLDCALPIIGEVCTKRAATRASDLLLSFVQWHANDIYEWHVISNRISSLPLPCARLSDNKGEAIVRLVADSKKPPPKA